MDGLRPSKIHTKPGYEKCWKELFKEECGDNSYENQIDYMEGTRKKKHMLATENIKKLFP